MLPKLALLSSLLLVSFIPINGLAVDIRQPQVGDTFTYHVWDTGDFDVGGAVLDTLETEVTRQVLIGSELWYTGFPPGTPFDESSFMQFAGNTVRWWDEGVYMEWTLGPGTPTISMTVPYGGPYQTYPLYYAFSPTHYQYNYLVPQIGIVGFYEYWRPDQSQAQYYPPGYEYQYYGELVAATLQGVPEPTSILLLGLGLIGALGLRRRPKE